MAVERSSGKCRRRAIHRESLRRRAAGREVRRSGKADKPRVKIPRTRVPEPGDPRRGITVEAWGDERHTARFHATYAAAGGGNRNHLVEILVHRTGDRSTRIENLTGTDRLGVRRFSELAP